MTPKPKYWLSAPPTACDLCSTPITTTFVDGKTAGGPWGIMCPRCFPSYGMGLGIGRGQRFELQPDGKWLCTKGASL